MYNIGSTVMVRGVVSPVTITGVIHTNGLVGYSGNYILQGVEMTISWIPHGLISTY